VVLATLAGLLVGLSVEGYIDLVELDPSRPHDSEVVHARGFPHPYLVTAALPGAPPPPRRVAVRNLATSCLFWLACSSAVLGLARWLRRSLQRSVPPLHYPMSLRLSGWLATSLAAATYADLFAQPPRWFLLYLGTALAVLPLAGVVGSRRGSMPRRRVWVANLLLATVLASASFTDNGLLAVPFVLAFLLVTIVVGIGFVLWLAPVAQTAVPD
jgi:hypothetical protein